MMAMTMRFCSGNIGDVRCDIWMAKGYVTVLFDRELTGLRKSDAHRGDRSMRLREYYVICKNVGFWNRIKINENKIIILFNFYFMLVNLL